MTAHALRHSAVEHLRDLGGIFLLKPDQVGRYDALRDLDVLVPCGTASLRAFVARYSQMMDNIEGCQMVSFIRNEYSIQLKYLRNDEMIPIDLLPDLTVRGLSTAPLAPLDHHQAPDGVRMLNHQALACYSTVRRFLLQGQGVEMAWPLIEHCVPPDSISRSRWRFFCRLLALNFKTRGARALVNVTWHALMVISRHLSPPGCVVVCPEFLVDQLMKEIGQKLHCEAIRYRPGVRGRLLHRHLYEGGFVVSMRPLPRALLLPSISVHSMEDFWDRLRSRAQARLVAYLGSHAAPGSV